MIFYLVASLVLDGVGIGKSGQSFNLITSELQPDEGL
jgi:hypothetical protein